MHSSIPVNLIRGLAAPIAFSILVHASIFEVNPPIVAAHVQAGIMGNASESDWKICGPWGCTAVAEVCGPWGCIPASNICPPQGCPSTPRDADAAKLNVATGNSGAMPSRRDNAQQPLHEAVTTETQAIENDTVALCGPTCCISGASLDRPACKWSDISSMAVDALQCCCVQGLPDCPTGGCGCSEAAKLSAMLMAIHTRETGL